ncbi:hypothetical protein DFH84_003684 [Clostridium saccharobutylicum]|nr:hypothetical protein [Clostridium saccharobutylicum]NYC29053.1 hypothetical protein [Clostridium saccharobutylicum]
MLNDAVINSLDTINIIYLWVILNKKIIVFIDYYLV